MQMYIGTKQITAKPLTLGDYNLYRGWKQPEGEDPLRAGYLVKYPDGYESWSPKETFEAAYQKPGELNYGAALHLLKQGHRVSRSGWNGKGMFIFLVPGSVFKVNRPPLLGIYPEGTEINYHGHIDMKTADDQVVPWLCSQTDALANDWGIVI